MHYFVYVSNLVGLQTNDASFRWSFGSNAPEVSKKEYDACRIKVELSIVPDHQVSLPGALLEQNGSFRFFHAERNHKRLWYHRKVLGLIPLSFDVSVHKRVVSATVGKTYYHLVRLKMMNLHPIWYVLFDLVTVLLLKDGYLPLYAASFAHDAHGALIMAPPNAGKTLTVTRLSNHPNVRLLGEDIAVTDGEQLFAVPWTDTYRNYGNKEKLPTAVSTEPAELGSVFLLDKGTRGVTTDGIDGIKQISLLNHYGIGYRSSPVITVLSYFNDDFSLEDISHREAALLRQIVQKAMVYKVTAENATEYTGLIYDQLQ